MDTTTLYEKEVSFQADRRRAGVKLIKIISDLWYDKSIEMVLFRNQLIDRNVSDIINLHGYAAEFVGKPISIFDSVKIAKAILELDLPPAKLDIGKLAYEFALEEDKYPDAKYFVIDKLKKRQKLRRNSSKRCCFIWFWSNWSIACQRIDVKNRKRKSIAIARYCNT